MAKQNVKCLYCGKVFDRNDPDIKWIKIGRRYAHQHCYEEAEANKTQEEKDLENLYNYCRQLFGKSYNYIVTRKLIEKYHTENGYSYTGIHRTLKYFYEIKNNPVTEKAHGTIGIVPSQYDNAYWYYRSIWEANQKSRVKGIEFYEPEVTKVRIISPERKVKKRALFTFLDEDTGGDN